jgi:hypothetical protein
VTEAGLTDRDDRVLDVIAEQYCLRTDVIAYWLGWLGETGTPVSGSTCRQVVGRWRKGGRVRMFGGGPGQRGFAHLTRSEAKRRAWPRWEPEGRDLRHYHGCTVARLLAWGVFGEGAMWRSERWLWRQAADDRKAGFPPDRRMPDAALFLPDGRTIAVEVELARKSFQVALGAMERLDDAVYHGVAGRPAKYDGQLWLTRKGSWPVISKAARAYGSERVVVEELPGLEDGDDWQRWLDERGEWVARKVGGAGI